MREPIAIIKQLDRRPAELVATDRHPRITLINQITDQTTQPRLIAADRDRPQRPRRLEQRTEIRVDVLGMPLPRPPTRERSERARRLQIRPDRLGLEVTGGLLRPPAPQHRLPHRLFQPKRPHPGAEHPPQRELRILNAIDPERAPKPVIHLLHQMQESRIAIQRQEAGSTTSRSEREEPQPV